MCRKTDESCESCASEIMDSQPDLIVLSTPYGINLSKALDISCRILLSLGIYLNPSASENAEWNNKWKNFKVDVQLENNLSNKLSILRISKLRCAR